MVKHIVCWTFKDTTPDHLKANIGRAKELLDALPSKISGIKHFEVGVNFNHTPEAYHLALYSEFVSKEALDAYLDHPEHQKVADYLRTIRDKRVVVDYRV